MTKRKFFFFYLVVFIWLYWFSFLGKGELFYSLLISIPFSPLLSLAYYGIHALVIDPLHTWLSKEKPKKWDEV